MQPEVECSDQVVARVVAWHNRHPLATRISADQVHSVGVVSLPYAVSGAEVQAAVAPPAAAALPAATAAVDLAVETADEAVSVAADAGQPAAAPDGQQAAVASAPPAAIVAILPARPRSWHPLTWWRQRRGEGPVRALFSEDFIAPLPPRRVARWVAAHGVGRMPLAGDAPRRLVALDPLRRRADDPAPEVELHVVTAAVGVGDQRHRLLLAPGERGPILGARHWSRPRLALAGVLLAALLLSAAALPWLHGRGTAPGVVAALAASQVAAASSPVALPIAAAAASEPSPEGASPAAEPAAEPAAMTDVAASAAPPADVPARRGRIDLDPVVPRLADAERQQLRREGRQLRGETPPAVEPRAWALVTAPLDARRAERAAVQLQAVALFQSLPMRVERMPAAGQRWRAVFWPFVSAQDAEKVRLALADKGLQTEVLEF